MTFSKASPNPLSTVGIFDSGVGGLSVLRAFRHLRSDVNTIFVADQAHVPYGPRPLEEVRGFATGIASYLIEEGADVVVVACNAASAAALYHLREFFPQVPFVGMEPAVKPAVDLSTSGIVGVLATPATFQGELYASVIERFAANVKVLTSTCPGLVQCIESGNLDGQETKVILQDALNPMLDAGVDTIVLGCTHYPFVIPLIEAITGRGVKVIDPSPAVARQIDRLLKEMSSNVANANDSSLLGQTCFCTTGDTNTFMGLATSLLDTSISASSLKWDNGVLYKER